MNCFKINFFINIINYIFTESNNNLKINNMKQIIKIVGVTYLSLALIYVGIVINQIVNF